MAGPTKAQFWAQGPNNYYDVLEVQFNPSTFTLTKSPTFAAIAIPGLDAPLQQFVRGGAETLTFDLFFDSTDGAGTGTHAQSVTPQTDQFYAMVKIHPETHAPPVCSFRWGTAFPGDSLPAELMQANQRRTDFTGIVTQVKQVFSLFSPEGIPLRATLSITMSEYRPLNEQLRQLNLMSADHTRNHVVADGETVSSVAAEYFAAPTQWRYLADANDVDDPRRISVGSSLVVPAIATPGVS